MDGVTTFILEYPDRVNLYIYASICYFNYIFISVLVMIFLNILLDFPYNHFFYPVTYANILFCLFRPRKQYFFQYFLSPPPPEK